MVSRKQPDHTDRWDNGKSVFPPFILFKRAKRFGSLDGWRAFAILGVLWHHTLGAASPSRVAQQGRHGVTLFFVISGFLIITLLLRSKERPAGFTLWKFWGRRTLRIFPIYYTVLALYAVLVHYTDHSPSGAAFVGNIPAFATFTTNWLLDPSDHTIFLFSWSLAAEEQFYLIWPLIEVLVSRPLPKFILLGLFGIVIPIAFAIAGLGDGRSLPLRILAHVPLGIALGTVLAHVLNNGTGFRLFYRVLGRRGSALGCLACAVLMVIVSPRFGLAGEVMIPVMCLLLVASTVIREDNDLAAVLTWRPVVWIGTVSYGMYLLHMMAINAVRKIETMLGMGSPAMLFLGGAAMAVALASLSFVFYERPFLMLKDRVFCE